MPLTLAHSEAVRLLDVNQLQRALAFYQSIKHLEVDFKQTKILKDLNLRLASEGHLTLALPDRVIWKIEKPQSMSVDLNQEKITIQSSTNTQTYSATENPSVQDRQNFATMLSWLKLDARAIAGKYEVRELAKRRYLFIAKETKAAVLKSLEMELTPAGHVAKLIFQEISGDEMRIQFAKPKVVHRRRQ